MGKVPVLRGVENMMFEITPWSDMTVANRNLCKFSHNTGIMSSLALREGSLFSKFCAILAGNEENARWIEDVRARILALAHIIE